MKTKEEFQSEKENTAGDKPVKTGTSLYLG